MTSRDHSIMSSSDSFESSGTLMGPRATNPGLGGTTHAGALAARVALIVARMTGKRVGLDTATRMLERGDGAYRSASHHSGRLAEREPPKASTRLLILPAAAPGLGTSPENMP